MIEMPQMVCDKCSWKSKDNDNLMQIDDDAMIHAMLTNFEHVPKWKKEKESE